MKEPIMLAEESTDRTGFRIWADDSLIYVGVNNFTFSLIESDFYIFSRLAKDATKKLLGLEETNDNQIKEADKDELPTDFSNETE